MILQANIGGYNGRLATVIGFLDVENATLYIQRADKFVNARFKDAGLISNQPLDDVDYFFSEQDFHEAFQAYRHYQNSQRLIFTDSAKRAMPQIQVDKITENGTQLSIFAESTNEQMGVIALCFFAQKASQFQTALEMYEDEEDFFTV